MRGWNPWTPRSWPEPKLDTYMTETPRYPYSISFFIVFFLFLFLRERARACECAHKLRRGTGREGKNLKQSPCPVWAWCHNCAIMTWAKIRRQMLIWLIWTCLRGLLYCLTQWATQILYQNFIVLWRVYGGKFRISKCIEHLLYATLWLLATSLIYCFHLFINSCIYLCLYIFMYTHIHIYYIYMYVYTYFALQLSFGEMPEQSLFPHW